MILSAFSCIGAKVTLDKNYSNTSLFSSSAEMVKELFYNVNKLTPVSPRNNFLDFNAEFTGGAFLLNTASRKG